MIITENGIASLREHVQERAQKWVDELRHLEAESKDLRARLEALSAERDHATDRVRELNQIIDQIDSMGIQEP